jgi:hypothetical protein
MVYSGGIKVSPMLLMAVNSTGLLRKSKGEIKHKTHSDLTFRSFGDKNLLPLHGRRSRIYFSKTTRARTTFSYR